MVLGQVRPLLEVDERVSVWAHVLAPEDEQAGLLSLTTARCLVHWNAGDEATATFRWDELTAWELAPRQAGATVLTLVAGTHHVEMRLPLTSDARARRAAAVVHHVAEHAPADVESSAGNDPPYFDAEPRGLRGHARRIGVTLVGLLVVLVSIVFASPFVPGPGALTFLAGLAILAREYDWARDVHRWVKRKFDQFWTWLRERRDRWRRRRAEVRDLAEARRRRATMDGRPVAIEPEIQDQADAQAQ